jgi:hypothetical protein
MSHGVDPTERINCDTGDAIGSFAPIRNDGVLPLLTLLPNTYSATLLVAYRPISSMSNLMV